MPIGRINNTTGLFRWAIALAFLASCSRPHETVDVAAETKSVSSQTDIDFESERDTNSERDRHDATSWAAEVRAQQFERPFARMWDRFRAADDKWQVLLDALAPSIAVGGVQTAEDLENGVRRIRLTDDGLAMSADAFRQRMSPFRQQGFQLVETEWHHTRFTPVGKAGPQSEFSFVLHVQRPPTGDTKELRAIVRGVLDVSWQPANDAGSSTVPSPFATTMHVRNLQILTRSGPPAFERVLSYSRRPDDVASAHPILLQDLDGNGFDDIIISRWNRAYMNQGSGQFVERPFVSHYVPHWETGVITDLDRDGTVDFLTVGKHGKVILFRGDAAGQFTTTSEIVAEPQFDSPLAVTVGDIDGDADLDVWLTQYRLSYVDGHMPTPYYDANDGFPAVMLINDGKGRFTDGTENAGLAAKRRRRTYSTSFVDLDSDRDLDLVVVSDFAGLDIYINDGVGHFTESTSDVVDDGHLFGMAHTFGDYNLDGATDLYAIGMSSTTARRLDRLNLGRDDRPMIHKMRAAMGYGNRMYLSSQISPDDQSAIAQYHTPKFAASVARTGWSWGATSFDFDNDQDTDIYVANGFRSGRSAQDYCTRFWCHDIYTGSSQPDAKAKTVLAESLRELDAGDISWNGYEHNVLLMNLGGEDFVNVGFLMGVGCEFDSRAVISNDLDCDGRLDLLVTQYEYDGRGFVMTLHVYRNNLANDNQWIGLRLTNEPDGLPLVGTQVRLVADGRTQIRQVITGDSWGAQHSKQLHFGLGSQTQIESVEVIWPDGERQRVESPNAGEYHRLTP